MLLASTDALYILRQIFIVMMIYEIFPAMWTIVEYHLEIRHALRACASPTVN